MVRGLDLFREHFREYTDQYVLIGGTACDLAMAEAGIEFRATKNLDIVLCVEALAKAFVEAFWTFVRDGEYQLRENSTAKKQYYRFQKPANDGYPFMLVFFSRVPDALSLGDESHLTPIPTDEEVSSLPAPYHAGSWSGAANQFGAAGVISQLEAAEHRGSLPMLPPFVGALRSDAGQLH